MGNSQSTPTLSRLINSITETNPARTQKQDEEPCPNRFDCQLDNEITSLSTDVWLQIFTFLPLRDQLRLQFSCKFFFNTYWDTRTFFHFDSSLSKEVFDRVNDKVLTNLLHRCDKKYLYSLRLCYCHSVSIAGISSVWDMEKLVELDLRHCYILTSAAMKPISNLVHLKSLNLSGCPLVGSSAQKSIASLKNLGFLNISGLTDFLYLSDIAFNLTNLKELHMLGCSSLNNICGNDEDLDPEEFYRVKQNRELVSSMDIKTSWNPHPRENNVLPGFGRLGNSLEKLSLSWNSLYVIQYFPLALPKLKQLFILGNFSPPNFGKCVFQELTHFAYIGNSNEYYYSTIRIPNEFFEAQPKLHTVITSKKQQKEMRDFFARFIVVDIHTDQEFRELLLY